VVELDGTRQVLEPLRRLRDAVGAGTAPAWEATARTGLDTRLLHHLPPPSVRGPDPDWLVAWRSSYRFGLCYYRRGPGFAVVRDHRAVATAARLVLDGVSFAVLEAFGTPRPIPRQGPEADAVARLAEAALLVVVGAHAMTLPYRLVRWPIPATAV
jgi:hypothetical protein